MCVIASRSCALPASPMCCRARASVASGGERQHQPRSRSRFIVLAIETCFRQWIGRDFQRSLDRFDVGRLTEERGVTVWKGQMNVEQTLKPMSPRHSRSGKRSVRYRPASMSMVARAAETPADDNEDMATQWFVVSDSASLLILAMTAFNTFVHSLETAAGRGAVEVRLLSRRQ